MSSLTHKFKIDQIVVIASGLPLSGKRGTISEISTNSKCYKVFVTDDECGYKKGR